MVATLTIAADDAAGRDALANLQKSLGSIEDDARQLTDVFDGNSEAIESTAREAAKLEKQLRETADAGRDVADAGDSAFGDGGGLGLLKLDAVLSIGQKMIEAFSAVSEVVDRLAESGNAGAVRLRDSFSEVERTLIRIANNKEFVDGMTDVADVVELRLIPALPSFTSELLKVSSLTIPGLTALATAFGDVAAGITDAEKAAAQAKANAERLLDVDQEIAATREQLAEQERVSRLATLDDVGSAMEEEKERMRQLGLAARISAEQQEEHRQKMFMLLQREEELRRELTANIERFREEEQQAREQEARDREQALNEQANLERQAAEEIAKIRQEAADRAIQAERRRVDEHISQVQKELDRLKGFRDGDQETENLLGNIQANLPDVAVAEQIRQTRAREFAQKQAEERRKLQERQAEETLRGQQDPNDNAGARIRRQREEQDLLRRQQERAERDFQRQQRSERLKESRGIGGTRASEDEIAQAQKELSAKVVDQAVQSGNLTEAQAQALRRAAEVAGQQAQRQSEIQSDVEAIQEQLDAIWNGLQQDGERARAQRVGRRR